MESLIQILSVEGELNELSYANRHIYIIIKNYRWDDSQTTRLLPLAQNSCCRSWRLTSGFCRPAPGKSTQVIRENWSPMSPLTDRNAHVHAIPLHSLTHRQPEKRWKVNNNNCNNHGRVKDERNKTGFLTLMTSFQQNHVHSLIQLHLSQAACFFSNEGYSRLFKSERHPRKELKLTIALCTEDYSLQF